MKIFEYILAVIFVYANGSWAIFENKYFVWGIMFICLFIYLFLLLWNSSFKIQIPNIFVLFLAGFPILSSIINFQNNINYLNVLNLTLTYIILSLFSNDNLISILDKYARVIFILSIVAIVFGSISLIDYSIITRFPVRYAVGFGGELDRKGYYNIFIYTDRFINDFRVQSIFWEPGAWAFNLGFSFYWLIFKMKEYKKLPFYILSFLLAFSTSGFLLLLLGCLIIFFFNDNNIRNRVFMWLIVSLVGVISLINFAESKYGIPISSYIKEQAIEKLSKKSDNNLSLESRLSSTDKAFKIASKNIVFGIGKINDSLFVTSTIAEIVYQLGFFYLLYFIFLFKKAFDSLPFIASWLFILIMLNGEAYGGYILTSLLLVYGANTIRIKFKYA
ncbi:MAG TPA: O-antigen ligase family protein [Bacteroidales bacterium]|nr:O-antigen ligase family protein [Bacteroidales bacterium]HPS17662.1 O-antigen ligase family protein [Bacteroidales bacterium]